MGTYYVYLAGTVLGAGNLMGRKKDKTLASVKITF